MLGREQQRQRAIRQLAGERQHLWPHGADVNGRAARRSKPQISLIAPVEETPVARRPLARLQPADGRDRLAQRSERCALLDAHPLEKFARPRRQPQVEAAAAELIHRGGKHGDLAGM